MNRPYRVLHVIDSLALGGAQVVLWNLLAHADRARFAPEVACMHGHGVFWERIRATGVPVRSLSFDHRFPSYVPLLTWLILTRRYDVVHCHLIAANVIAKPLAALLGVPVRINHDHCNDKLADPRQWVPAADTWTNRFSTHICAVSESTRRFLVAQEGVAGERVTTIHNGIDLVIFQPRPEERAAARQRLTLPEDAFVIAGIGRLTYQKNFALFLEVAAEVVRRHPHAVFVLAGTGEEEAALRAQAAALGLGERVRFLGYVADMVALYPALDMLLLTSRYEGLPITILEAMACGVPIVASRLDGVQEVLRDAEDGALVPEGDRAGFITRVDELIAQPALARRYADAALTKVRAEYSAETMTRAVEAIYLRHLESRPMNDWLCDWEVNRGNPKGQIVLLLFRIAQWVRALPEPWWLLGAPYLAAYRLGVEWGLGIELRFRSRVGPRLRLYHGQALVVHEDTVIGADCTLRQSTTIGNKTLADGSAGACPVLGDGVDVGANAVILGAIKIGDRAVIGAGSVVVKDVPPGAVVAGNPARVIRQR